MKRAWLVLVLLVSPAQAEDRAAAERYFRAGAKAYAAQNFAAAATNFDEAYQALPMPEIAFSAAQAYRKLYQIDPQPAHVRRAVELYQKYLADVKQGGRVGDAADNLADMKRELAKLEAAGVNTAQAAPVVAKTQLGANVTVADQAPTELGVLREIGEGAGDSLKGLVVTLDNTKIEPFALVDVDPSKEHVLTAEADGYYKVEKKVVAVDKQQAFVDLELRPKPAKLAVKTEAGARISIDGRHVATTPAAALDVQAGKHLVTVLRSGREPYGKEISVTRGQALDLEAPLAKTGRRKAVPWVLGGAGVLAAGAVTTAILANRRDSRASELRDQIEMGNRPPGDADLYDDAVRDRDRFVTWTWVLGGAALATGTVGGLLFFFDNPSADSASVGVGGSF